MKIAYFDCISGISGDMTLGALVDAGVPAAVLEAAVRSVVPQVKLEAEVVQRKGFRATKVHVVAPHEHAHRHLSSIVGMIQASASLSEKCKRQACEIFGLIARAEAKVHGTDVEKVHFHEVGALDSIADVVATVAGLDWLGVDAVQASAVPTGCGTVEIAHGMCSVPAPATAELLLGVPLAASEVPFELTTPTGAALLKYYATQFGPRPAMTVRAVGLGAGGRDLAQQPNILRVMLGECENACGPKENADTVWMLETNLDDCSGEWIGHCVEKLWALGPLDVWTTGVSMKKQRPGVTVSVLCRREQVAAVEAVLFRETTTLGVRRWPVERTVLARETCQIATPLGTVDAKVAVLTDGSWKVVPEFESAKKLATACGVSVREIFESVRRTAEPQS